MKSGCCNCPVCKQRASPGWWGPVIQKSLYSEFLKTNQPRFLDFVSYEQHFDNYRSFSGASSLRSCTLAGEDK